MRVQISLKFAYQRQILLIFQVFDLKALINSLSGETFFLRRNELPYNSIRQEIQSLWFLLFKRRFCKEILRDILIKKDFCNPEFRAIPLF